MSECVHDSLAVDMTIFGGKGHGHHIYRDSQKMSKKNGLVRKMDKLFGCDQSHSDKCFGY